MAKTSYDRYAILKNDDGSMDMMPFVKISERPTDKYIYWNFGISRLDKLSEKYYGNPFYDFLIRYANPQYISEYDIEDNELVRIPFPLSEVKKEYETFLQDYKNEIS